MMQLDSPAVSLSWQRWILLPWAREVRRVVISAIDGVAGIGKTALAVHFGHRVAVAFPDGQLYANLRGLILTIHRWLPMMCFPDSCVHWVLTPQTSMDLDEMAGLYRSLLSSRRILVVLDNAATAEQIPAAAARDGRLPGPGHQP